MKPSFAVSIAEEKKSVIQEYFFFPVDSFIFIIYRVVDGHLQNKRNSYYYYYY
jgi:hypothetical protein